MTLSMKSKLDYHHWANLKLLNHVKSLQEDLFQKDVQSVFPSIAAVFEHVFQVDVLWLNRILDGEGPLYEDVRFESPLMAIHYYNEIHDYYKKLRYDSGRIRYKNSKGEVFQNGLDEIIDHLINHGTYHRGNVTAILHQLGEKSVSTDLIFFLRQNLSS